MDPENHPTVTGQGMTAVHDAIIERGVQFLVIFCPLAFGTVHPWAAAVMELIAFLMLGAWMLKCAGEGQVPVPRTASLVAAIAFVLLVAAQLVPLPGGLLQAFSPRTAEALAAAGIADDGVWRPLSLQPQATREGLFALFAYVAVFLVVTQHYRTTKQVRRTVDTVLAVAVVLVLFAVLQKMTWNGRLYWVFPVSPGIESDLNYIWGPYINRNHFAGYLEIAAPLGMGLFLHQIASRRSGQGRRDGRTVIRLLSSGLRSRTVLYGSATAIIITGVFLCMSRGGMLGIVAAMIFFAVITRRRRALRKQVAVIVAVGAFFLAAIVLAAGDRIAGRFGELADTGKVMRLQIWKDSLQMVADHAFAGTGFGTFDAAFPRYQTRYSTVRFEHAENDYIEVATDTGLTGLALVLAAAVRYILEVLRAWSARSNIFVQCIAAGGLASCVALAVHGLTDFNLRIPANAMLLTIVAAVTWATAQRVSSREGAHVRG